jgi:catechol 2,3-dioxygenase-like lactoylglutathione lyase family enzyme
MPADRPLAPRLLHASLAVSDLDRSLAFYTALFGGQVVLDARGMTGLIRRTTGLPGVTCDLAQLRLPGADVLLELIAFRDVPAGREDDAPVRAGHGHVCVGVADLDAGLAQARRHGATPVGQVVAYPEGRSVYLREPGGSVLELEELGAPGGTCPPRARDVRESGR